jgi:DoxX-like family
MTTATLQTSTSIHTHTAAASKTALWSGRVMSGLVTAFLAFDAAIKLVRVPMAIKGTAELGYSPSVLVPLGVVLLACLALYLIPRTAVVGAVFLTGYLGGAIATHVRVGNPVASHVLFPVYVAILVWGGLYLRDQRVRALIGPRR